MSNWNIDTLCVQGAYKPKSGEPRVLPLYQSTTYKYDTTEELADLFDLKKDGHMYSRISNPTVEALENKIALLEEGIGAVATSSGQSATLNALLTICSSGDNIICSSQVYGGTYNLLNVTLRKLGIDVRFVKANSSGEEIYSLSDENTKAVFGETISNPGCRVLNFEEFSKGAKRIGVPLIVDNTFATPYLCKPFKYGANIIIHSTTKYMDGHGSCVGGIIVDGGNFNWENKRFKEFIEPDDSYHGVIYSKDFKNMAYIVKARVQLLRDLGNCMSPFNAYLTNLGLETLHLRMERHSENALALSQWLENHPKVSWVNYPLLKGNKDYAIANKYLNKGASGVITFGLKGGKKAGEDFVRNLKLVSLVIHVADVRSSVLHPSSTTHRQLSEEEQIKAGVSPELIRFSVGIESIDDIIRDVEEALK